MIKHDPNLGGYHVKGVAVIHYDFYTDELDKSKVRNSVKKKVKKFCRENKTDFSVVELRLEPIWEVGDLLEE